MDMRGNRHAQAQHDGVTLKDHCKYQSLALNFSLEDTNWTVAFAFCKCHDGTNQGVAKLFKTKFKAASGLEAHTVCRTSISDEAAAGANMLLLEKTSDTSELVDGDLLDAEVDECVRPNCNGGAL